MEEEKSRIKVAHGPPQEMTFEEWLSSAGDLLPEGFREWRLSKFFWEEGQQVGWAILQFDKHLKIQGKKPSREVK